MKKAAGDFKEAAEDRWDDATENVRDRWDDASERVRGRAATVRRRFF
jgi:hypothetical protein